VKRLALLVAVLLAVSACSADDDAALTVNGVLTVSALQDQLDELAADDEFLTSFDGRGAGAETLSAGFVSSVLSNHVLTSLLESDLEAEGVEVTEEDVAEGTEQLAGAVGGDVEAIPASYRELLVDLFAYAAALRGHLDGDEAALQERITTLLTEAEVEVAARYGSWDEQGSSVIPPEGPIAATTTTPLLDG
jgi:hypothetical protein